MLMSVHKCDNFLFNNLDMMQFVVSYTGKMKVLVIIQMFYGNQTNKKEVLGNREYICTLVKLGWLL